MSRLSEKQLLLLDNLMYCEAVTSGKYPTVQSIVDDLLAHPENSGKRTGSSDSEKLNKILTEISKDSTLMNLEIGKTHRDNGSSTEAWSATCFVDPDTKEATIAFRGTGGTYEAWFDNLEGAGYAELSPMQSSVRDWVQSLSYRNISVTGHSKGGNLAQLAAILCSDLVSRCVSYDGQGFSEEFLKKFKDEIAVACNKIKSISAYNDYVNILMFPIAGEVVYVNNNESMFPGGHFSENLLWDNEFDENGDFISTREQGYIAKGLSILNKTLLVLLPPSLEETMSDALGVVVGHLFDKDSESAKQALNQLLQSIANNLVNLSVVDVARIGYVVGALVVSIVVSIVAVAFDMAVDGIIAFAEYIAHVLIEAGKAVLNWTKEQVDKCVAAVYGVISAIKEFFNIGGIVGQKYVANNPFFKVDTDKLRSYAIRINNVNNRLRNLDRELRSLYWQVGFLDLWDIMMANLITSGSPTLMQIKSYLNNAAERFEKAENKARGNMGG